MSRRTRAAIPFLILALSLAAAPVAAMEIGPPARNLDTYREGDAGYLSIGWTDDTLEMKELDDHAFTAPGVREVKRQLTYASFAWLPSDRVEMDVRVGFQGMTVGDALRVEGRTFGGDARYAGLLGGGIRWLAWDHPDAGLRAGVAVDGSISPFRWREQVESFRNAQDNLVGVSLRFGELAEARIALPLSKSFRFDSASDMDTANPRGLSSTGGVGRILPDITAIEVYGGPFARAAYMYGTVSASAGGTSLGYRRFHLLQDSFGGFFAGLRAYGGRTHRYSLGLEGRYQSELSVSLRLDASL